MERQIVIFSSICACLVLYTSFSTPKDLVVLSFLTWGCLSLSAGICNYFQQSPSKMYFIFGFTDILIALISFMQGATLGIENPQVLIFFLGSLLIALGIILIGKKYKKTSSSVTGLMTFISFFFVLIYYIETKHKVSMIYLSAVILAQYVLFLQLMGEDFLNSKIPLKDRLFLSCPTLVWNIGNTLGLVFFSYFLITWKNKFAGIFTSFFFEKLQKIKKIL